MANYGTFKYGDGTKYGVSAVTGYVRWAVEIDWNRDGIFDGTNEADHMFSVNVNRGRKRMMKQTGQGFEIIPPGKCVIKLRNNDGRYDGWNDASPLYPYVTYGADVRIRVKNQSDGLYRHFFFGMITDIRPFGYGGDAYVEIEIEDSGRYLRSYPARSPITTNVSPGTAINNILDAVGWPTRWGREIDNGTGTINFHWASGNKLAWSELEDVSQSFLGLFFIAANGKAKFIDRNTEPVNVLDLSQDILLKDISNPQPWVNRRNVTRIKVHPMQEATLGVIYQVIGDPILVEAGTTKYVWANYTYNGMIVPARNVLQPEPITDYLANTNDDGSGPDRTADCVVTITDFGDTAKMAIINTSATNFYLTKRQIQGNAIYEENISDITFPEDSSTVAEPREFVLNQRWQQSVNVAIDYSIFMGTFLDVLHYFPVVKMEGRPDIQFDLDLFNTVTLDIGKLGITGQSFRVGAIEHRSLNPTCQAFETKIYLEPYLTNGEAWTWPILDFGTDTIFGAG